MPLMNISTTAVLSVKLNGAPFQSCLQSSDFPSKRSKNMLKTQEIDLWISGLEKSFYSDMNVL